MGQEAAGGHGGHGGRGGKNPRGRRFRIQHGWHRSSRIQGYGIQSKPNLDTHNPRVLVFGAGRGGGGFRTPAAGGAGRGSHTGACRHRCPVGHVEGGVDIAAKMQVDEIGHMAVHQPVEEDPRDAAAEQAKRGLDGPLAQPERFTPDADGHRRRPAGHAGEHRAAPGKNTPGRAGVAHMDQVKKARRAR